MMSSSPAKMPLDFSRLCIARRRAKWSRMKRLARATRLLYASCEPFAPYRTVNAVQRAVPLELPSVMRLLIPRALMQAAGLRARQIVTANANAIHVQEAILGWASPYHRAGICVPGLVWPVWPGEVARLRSASLFAMFLIDQFLRGLRRVGELARYRQSQCRQRPFVVAVNVPSNAVDCASHGGILFWLRHSAPLSAPIADIVVASDFVKPSATTPLGVVVSEEPFASLRSLGARFEFVVCGYLTACVAAVLGVSGCWQALVLLQDIVEQQYVRRIDRRDLASVYAFFLGDMARRPLWTFVVNERGSRTPLIFYASSYSLFAYDGVQVEQSIRNPVVLMNIWDECWFQTEAAASAIRRLSGRAFSAHVVGAFDVVDDKRPLPSFGQRSIGVFDIEPTARALRWTMAGYILPGFTEARILQFWEHLLTAAKAHDLVLVHKPKRAANLRQEWRYRILLAEAAREGRYVELSPETGPVRLLASLPASIILPFTSVGDLALATGVKAAFLDPEGTIARQEEHAGGLLIVSGDDELNAWLASIFGVVNGRPRALTQT
jgi:hypothetical protein